MNCRRRLKLQSCVDFEGQPCYFALYENMRPNRKFAKLKTSWKNSSLAFFTRWDNIVIESTSVTKGAFFAQDRRLNVDVIEVSYQWIVIQKSTMGLLPLEFTECLQDSPYFRDSLHSHEKELERTSNNIKELIKEVKNLLHAAKSKSTIEFLREIVWSCRLRPLCVAAAILWWCG